MIATTLMIASPILIAAIGGMISERSGIINIALEGLMIIGAMTAAIVHVLLESEFTFSIPLALFLASISGGFLSLLHAWASISLKANQVISGTGINFLSNGLSVFICQILFRMDRTPNYRMGMLPGAFGIYPTIWLALIILFIYWFVIYKSPWGLRLRASGENPDAAISAGVNVKKIRYIAVILSGMLASLAGASLVFTQDIQFTVNAVNGKGFIALAAISFGRWMPLGVLGASLLFGLSSSFAVNIINVNILSFLPSEIFNMMPFLITLITLILFNRNSEAPKALGT